MGVNTRALTGMVVGLMLLAACGGDDGDGDETDEPDGTEEASSTDANTPADDDTDDTPLSPEEEVLRDYMAAIDALDAAYDPPDPEHPDLLVSYAGQALSTHQTILANYLQDGVSEVALSVDNDPKVRSLVGDKAVVVDCYEEVLQMIDTPTREPREEPRTETGHVERHLELIDGTWKIVSGESQGEPC